MTKLDLALIGAVLAFGIAWGRAEMRLTAVEASKAHMQQRIEILEHIDYAEHPAYWQNIYFGGAK